MADTPHAEGLEPCLVPPGLRINILPILACPACKCGLKIEGEDSQRVLLCPRCGESYAISDGIPYFLPLGEKQFVPQESYVSISSEVKRWAGTHQWIYNLLWMLYPTPVRNCAVKRIFRRILGEMSSESLVLNLGSGETQGVGMDMVQSALPGRIVNLDVQAFKKVGVVADGHRLPFRDGVFDLVILKCLLEHVRDPERVVQECSRVLTEGGLIYSETPFISRYHGDLDFRRWTPLGLEELFHQFSKVESGVGAGPGSAIGLALREFIASFSEHRYLHPALKFIASWLTFPLKYFDIFLVNKKYSYKLAQSFYFLGQKPTQSVSSQ
jgi:SAM-dependent methyltransferase/uncharacterized protein YbaR (Trm112 family)